LTIVVIDHRVLIRDCLVRCLKIMNGNCVALAFASVEEWQQVAAEHPSPAMIVLCPEGRKDDEIEHDLALLSAGANVSVVIVSEAEDIDHILAALDSGARGYIPTSVTLDVAVEAMRLVEAGGTFIPASSLTSSRRRDEAQHHVASQSRMFTERQTAVLEALRKGKANKQIAYELKMREGTVKAHVRNIMRKLNARNRTEVAILTSGLPES